MKSRSQTRFGVFAVLALLMLVAVAAGAQAALAAHLSNGSAVTTSAAMTPAAGTEGRGGAALSTTTTVVSTTPQAGTDGRGGASLTVAALTPRAGTEGRGGVAAVEAATLAGESTVAENGFVSRGRGGFPSGPTGVDRTLAVSSVDSSSAGWIAAGIVAAIALIAGFVVWAADRRRRWQRQSSLASYCTYHPGDPLCGRT